MCSALSPSTSMSSRSSSSCCRSSARHPNKSTGIQYQLRWTGCRRTPGSTQCPLKPALSSVRISTFKIMKCHTKENHWRAEYCHCVGYLQAQKNALSATWLQYLQYRHTLPAICICMSIYCYKWTVYKKLREMGKFHFANRGQLCIKLRLSTPNNSLRSAATISCLQVVFNPCVA